MHRTKKATTAALVAGGLLLGSGIAAALDLPDQPEKAVAEEKVADVEAPPAEPQANAATHRKNEDAGKDDGEASSSDAAGNAEGAGDGERPTDTHGYEVSQLATTTESDGREKGEEISTLAKTNGAEQRSEHARDGSEQSAEVRATHGR